jgi:hypothetical protein
VQITGAREERPIEEEFSDIIVPHLGINIPNCDITLGSVSIKRTSALSRSVDRHGRQPPPVLTIATKADQLSR